MNPAISIADAFFPADKMIVYLEGSKTPRQDFKSTGLSPLGNARVVVLTDEGSASASEILAGAFQDWDRGVIAGRRTFGKGLVQNGFYLTDGSMVQGINGCEKSNPEDKHEWGAEGIYYANEGLIRLTGCGAQKRHRAEGNLYLVGEGFEGEYTCYDADDDGLMYSVAISAYEIGE